VSLVVNDLDHGHSVEALLDDYPNLTPEDVEAACSSDRLPRHYADANRSPQPPCERSSNSRVAAARDRN
jgi:hypothetical protein